MHSHQCPPDCVSLWDSTVRHVGVNLFGGLENQWESNEESEHLTWFSCLLGTTQCHWSLSFSFVERDNNRWPYYSMSCRQPPKESFWMVLPECGILPFWSSSHMLPEKTFQKHIRPRLALGVFSAPLVQLFYSFLGPTEIYLFQKPLLVTPSLSPLPCASLSWHSNYGT